MPKPFASVLEASLILGTCTPAMAVQCGDRESLVEHLNDKFSERLSSTGRDERGRVAPRSLSSNGYRNK